MTHTHTEEEGIIDAEEEDFEEHAAMEGDFELEEF